MINAIAPINGFSDPEEMRIIRELMQLGLTATGNKSIDKSKLEQAKSELINKIQQKDESNQAYGVGNQAQLLAPVDETQDAKRSEMEVQRLGAMNVAELNKIYFGL